LIAAGAGKARQVFLAVGLKSEVLQPNANEFDAGHEWRQSKLIKNI
jgi:hypothetical protein